VLGLAAPFHGETAIHLLDLQTHEESTVAGSDGLFSPRWSPDGRYIAALPLNGESLRLYEVAKHNWLDGETSHRLSKLVSGFEVHIFRQRRDVLSGALE
jgi:hypothetical protein